MSPEIVTTTKKEAATCQLETAIKLFLENRDLISSYTLCCAADGILEGIYENKRDDILNQQFHQSDQSGSLRFSFSEELEMQVKPQYKKRVFQSLRAAQNFFKHADRDHDNCFQFADWNLTSIRLLTAIHNYDLVYREITLAMQLYVALYATINPDHLVKESPLRDLMALLPDVEVMSERLSREEVSVIGYSTLKSCCPELFK